MKLKSWHIFSFYAFLFLLLTKFRGTMTWNDSSRMATIESLVKFQTFIIDQSTFMEKTLDRYLYNGHFYSDKPPILSIYGAIYYFFIHHGLGITLAEDKRLAYYLITFFTIGLLTALSMVYFYKIVQRISGDDSWSGLLTLVVGMGTLFFSYSMAFNNHTFSGALTIIAFYYLMKFRQDKTGKVSNVIISGFLLSLSGAVDIICFIFVIFAGIFFLEKRRISYLPIFILSTLPMIFIYFGLNIYTAGGLKPPAMNPSLWDYPGSAFSPASLSGVTSNSFSELLSYSWQMLFWYKGFFLHTPLMLLAVYALVKKLSQANFSYKPEFFYILMASGSFLFLYLTRSNNYSGCAYGVRWFATIMPLMGIALAALRDEVKYNKMFGQVFLGLSVISMIMALMGTYEPFQCHFAKHIPSFVAAIPRIITSPNPYRLRFLLIFLLQFFLLYKLWKAFKTSQPVHKIESPTYF